jgi:hypothetical protein
MAKDVTLERASTFITIDDAGEVTDAETLDIGGKTYTFKATVGTADGAVHIGAAVEDTVDNLIAAINLTPETGETGTEGTDYGEDMTINPLVHAAYIDRDDGTVRLYSKVPGAIGNLIAVANGTATATVDNATMEDGVGSVDAFFTGLFALNQINSELVSELRQFSVVEGGPIDGVIGAP